jgi:hypothetical protein
MLKDRRKRIKINSLIETTRKKMKKREVMGETQGIDKKEQILHKIKRKKIHKKELRNLLKIQLKNHCKKL